MVPMFRQVSGYLTSYRVLSASFAAIAIGSIFSPQVSFAQPETKQDSPTATTDIQKMPPAAKSYIGIGGTVGLSGNTSSLGTGGFSILSRRVLNDSLSIHGNTVVFGSATASSAIALTLNFPVRDSKSQEIVVSPFFGGGIQFRKEESTYISPLAVGGVDIPIKKSLTGTVRVQAAFPNTGKADVGATAGIGYSF